METKTYNLQAEIAGKTTILNGPIKVRMGDCDTPILDVSVKFLDASGQLLPFNLTNKRITFECVVPYSGLTFVDDGSIYSNLKIISNEGGRFQYLIPYDARGTKGKTHTAYFRFHEENPDFEFAVNIQSTGNFAFEVEADAYNTGAGVELFHSDVRKLAGEVSELKKNVEEIEEDLIGKQDKIPNPVVDNIATLAQGGNTKDSGVNIGQVTHSNRVVLDNLGDDNKELTFYGKKVGFGKTVLSILQPPSPVNVWVRII